MSLIKLFLFVNFIFYYGVCFFLAFGGFGVSCQDTKPGIDTSANVEYYVAYMLLSALAEVYLLWKLKITITDFKPSSWHFIRLVAGQMARLDFFTDLIFVAIVMRCEPERYWLFISSFIILFLT